MSFAQEDSKATVFGGYSFMRLDAEGSGINANGWNAALTGNVTKNFGITADFAGHYNSDLLDTGVSGHSYSYLFGPQVGTYVGKAHPFAHVLFGANTIGGEGLSDTGWAVAFGGGLDVNVAKNVGLRIGQFDYMRSSHFDTGINNYRFSTGIVFNLGGSGSKK
jgi:hypothetical protein